VADWTPSEGKVVRTPALVFPETTLAAPPQWANLTLGQSARPTGSAVHIVSGGTWFHPTPAGTGPLVVPAIQPAPTSTVQVIPVGPELAVLHDAGGWAHNPKNLVEAFVKASREATPGRLLWAPALGTPQDYALWAYLGVDLFDASPLLLAATRGQALGTDGTMPAADAARMAGKTPLGFDALVAHNLEAARAELERVRLAIEQGNLRQLVERRIYASAASVEILRRFDREHAFLAQAAPSHRAVPLPCMTAESLWMPEVETFRRAFRDRYEPPASARVLLLLPCSRGKPYKMSRSHRLFARTLDDSGIRSWIHEVMITSPLGLVPRELEEIYPAQAYDIPVTGHWTADEEIIVREQLASLLAAHDYEHVVVHASQVTFDVLRSLLPEHVRHTCLHHPTSRDDLGRLATELARLRGLLGHPDARQAGRGRKLDDLQSVVSFQFGHDVAAELTKDAQTRGRTPYVKLLRGDVQLGTTTPDRGVLSLTLEGARILARHGMKRVRIGDFKPKGTSSLFAVGVESADDDIHPGDEVVVVHGEEVRGAGVAQMSGAEMTHSKRGVAVALRHTLSSPSPIVEVSSEPEEALA
jgi:archaeosine synthase